MDSINRNRIESTYNLICRIAPYFPKMSYISSAVILKGRFLTYKTLFTSGGNLTFPLLPCVKASIDQYLPGTNSSNRNLECECESRAPKVVLFYLCLIWSRGDIPTMHNNKTHSLLTLQNGGAN